MHRTYSLRQSHATTALNNEKHVLPTASTKGGCLLCRTNFGHVLRKETAGIFSPDLAKKSSQLVQMEKNIMRSMELVGRERMEVAAQLSLWGEDCDDDVSDVADKLGVLTYEIGELEDQLVDRHNQYRMAITAIRDIEASVGPTRGRKQKIIDQVAMLKYSAPESDRILVREQELVRAEAESLVAEAQLSNITREKLKTAFTYQFEGMSEHYEKVAIIAGYGKQLLEMIDIEPLGPGKPRPSYNGYEASNAIVQHCEESLTGWALHSLSMSAPHLRQRSKMLMKAQGRRLH